MKPSFHKHSWRTSIALVATILLSLGSQVRAADKVVRVSAAASLGDVLKAIDADFEKETGIKVELNLGASNVLARQIEEARQ
jgi:ABC-type molybdate transport system substrate-binding protein